MDTVEAKLSNASYDRFKNKLIDGYQLDESLSNDNASTYYHPEKKHTIIAYRGTKPTNQDDLAADADIALGKRNHKRFKEAVDHALNVMSKYSNVDVTGHSLGGTQALHVHDQLGLKAKVFNPGSSLFAKEKKFDSNKVDVYRDENDLVSSGHVRSGNPTKSLGKRKRGPVLNAIRKAIGGPLSLLLDQWESHSLEPLPEPDSALRSMYRKIFNR